MFIHISYIDGIDGNNILILKEHDVKVITDLMMGGDGSNTDGELSEMHLSAISEAMNQMMGSAATSLSSMLEKKVDISPPTASLVDLNDSMTDDTEISNFLQGEMVQVAFDMEIGDLVDSQIMQLYPFEFARDLYRKFIGESKSEIEEPQPQASQPTPAATPEQTVNVQNVQPAVPPTPDMQQMAGAMPVQSDMMQQSAICNAECQCTAGTVSAV